MYVKVGTANIRALRSFREMVENLSSARAQTELQRGVTDVGRKVKTKVQKAVAKQMALRPGNYNRYVVAGTRGVSRKDLLAYDIFGVKGGTDIEEYKGLRAVKASNRMNVGRRGADRGEVRSAVWNAPRIFKRSFVGAGGGFFAMRPPSAGTSSRAPKALWTFGLKPGQPRGSGGRFASTGVRYGKVRRLYGPALMKEIPEDHSLDVFLREGPILLEQAVSKRLTKLVRC